MDYKNLNFDIHLKFVERKIVCAVGILNKLKCYFPKKNFLLLYHAVIFPHLLYAIPLWGCTDKSYLHNIGILKHNCKTFVHPILLKGPRYLSVNNSFRLWRVSAKQM